MIIHISIVSSFIAWESWRNFFLWGSGGLFDFLDNRREHQSLLRAQKERGRPLNVTCPYGLGGWLFHTLQSNFEVVQLGTINIHS